MGAASSKTGVPYYDAWVKPFVDNKGVILASAGTWFVLQKLAQKWVNSSRAYKDQDEDTREDMSCRLVAVAHSLVLYTSIPYFLGWWPSAAVSNPDSLYTISPEIHKYFCISTGFFIWDTFNEIFIRREKNASYIIHGVMATLANYSCLYPYNQGYSLFYTGYLEVSSIFLNASEMLGKISTEAAPKNRSKLKAANRMLFAASFLAIRVGHLTVQNYKLFNSVVPRIYARDLHSNSMACLQLGCCGVNMALQYFWAQKVVSGSIKYFRGERIGEHKLDELDEDVGKPKVS